MAPFKIVQFLLSILPKPFCFVENFARFFEFGLSLLIVMLYDEQRAKIESMEASLRHKVQELLAITGNFNSLKHLPHNLLLVQFLLSILPKPFCFVENFARFFEFGLLRHIGAGLVTTLNGTIQDVNGLHAKLDRKDNLEMAPLAASRAASGKYACEPRRAL
jgi:hypothetical protein